MTTKRGQIAMLRREFDPEMAQYAALAFPDRERETEAQRLERERIEAERTAEALAQRETRDAVMAGTYGKEAKAKATEYAIVHGKDSPETLKYCSVLADKVRKAEHYKRLAIAKKKTEVD
jgi:hypothetical protein